MEIALALAKAEPWISAWDGRNQRLPSYNSDTLHRQLDTIKDILETKSVSATGKGWRFKEMERGMKLVKETCNYLGLSLDCIDESSFLNRLGLASNEM